MSESIHDRKLNKGEWAEFYVMLRLLGEGKLYTANELLKKNYKSYLDILKIIREEIKDNVLEYIVDDDRQEVSIVEQSTGKTLVTIEQELFNKNADMLFEDLKEKKGRSINAPKGVCDFAGMIYVTKPKAPSVKSLAERFGGKNDIFIEVRDSHTAIISVMGFSIKSKFASKPTLFNAGTSSQFLFEISNCDDTKMNEFNSISDEKGRGWEECKKYLNDMGMELCFYKVKNPIYNDNMVLIRESMPDIMAWCVKDRLIDETQDHNVKETTERMINCNPLGVSNPEAIYEKAVKDFLMAGFTGMTAAKQWDGKEQVDGGYIAVMEDGDVLCYHSNDREAFRDYLYRNTYFEYVSTSKYNWGSIEKTDEKYILPLNFSVRFNSKTR